MLFLKDDDLHYLAKPLIAIDKKLALPEEEKWGLHDIEETESISIIVTVEILNISKDNALERAGVLLGVNHR